MQKSHFNSYLFDTEHFMNNGRLILLKMNKKYGYGT